jgi:hypothetical protein
MTCGGSHLGFRIGMKKTKFVEDLQMIILGQFGKSTVTLLTDPAFFLAKNHLSEKGSGIIVIPALSNSGPTNLCPVRT